MILYSHRLYALLAPWLTVFERRTPHRETEIDTQEQIAGQLDVIVFGLGRYGGRLALGLQQAGLTTLGVDFDPETVRHMTSTGLRSVRYGDGIDADFLDQLPLGSTSWIISTFPDISSNLGLLNALQNRDCSAEVAFVVRVEGDILTLKQAGAPTVLYPINNAVDHAIETLTEIMCR
jgi:Trk K+ transport system NAD-binding subunit